MHSTVLSRLLTLLLLLCAGCADDFTGVDPPADGRLYFPGRMAVSDDASTVYIVNTNYDQRFNASWISTLDTNTLLTALAQKSDPSVAIDPNRKLKVPMSGGQLVLDPNRNRAYLTSRGSGMLTSIDIAADGTLSCGDNDDDSGLPYILRRTDCAATHLLDFTSQAAPNNLGNNNMATNFADPFAAALVPNPGGTPDTLLAVGFMSSQFVALLDPTSSDSLPKYLRVNDLGNTATLSISTNINKPGQFIAGNHVVNNVTARGLLYFVDAAESVAQGINASSSFNLNEVMGSFEVSDLVQSDDGQQLFAASRNPDGVASISLGAPNTYNAQRLRDGEGLAGSLPSVVRYLPRAVGDNLVVVNNLQQDSIHFYSAVGGRLQIVQRLDLPEGKGPFDIQRLQTNGSDLLLVTTFFDHGLNIIDITPAQPSQFKVVATIHQGDLGVPPRFR